MIRVLLLALDPSSPEEQAAWQWLARASGFQGRQADAAEPGDNTVDDVVWVHAAAPPHPTPALITSLRARQPRGGWLLTGGAAALAAPLGLGPPPVVQVRAWHDAEDELFFHDSF